MITAYLFHAGEHNDPARLRANSDKSFIGSYVLGMGFTFDDTDAAGVTNSIAEMHRLIAEDPRNGQRIFPFLGGEEINDNPTHAPHRFVINFADMTESEARHWPDLMQILERKVKPERELLRDNADARRRKAHWWLWGRYTPALFEALRGRQRTIVQSQVSSYLAITFVPASLVFAHTVNVFAFEAPSPFCVLQSRVHEVWGRFFSSSLEDRLRYNASDSFETFPFPRNFELDVQLEKKGQEYYEFRAAVMIQNNAGLTKTYNRFHDPDETSPDIIKLRELHTAMDKAVLDAYGWSDIPTLCEFILDYEDEEEEETGRSHKRKKPYRYRWPDEVRDKVLARLLKLNVERAEEERLVGVASAKDSKAKPSKPSKAKVGTDQIDLF